MSEYAPLGLKTENLKLKTFPAIIHHQKPMPICPMSQPVKNFLLATITAALFLTAPRAISESPFLPGGARTLHLAGAITNGTVTVSWPFIAGHWELMTQQPADTGEWQAVSANLYHTNNTTVSVTQPLPAKPALYRLRRVFPKLANSQFPPMPKMPTNRPVRPQ
jgi:hypothetical protein